MKLNNKLISDRFKEARMECGLTQTELSEMSGISRVTISKLENGLLTDVNSEALHTLSWVLKKEPRFFATPYPVIKDTTIPSYRSFVSKQKKDNDITLLKLKRGEDFVHYLFSFIKARYSDLNNVISPESIFDITDTTIEALALDVRESWGIGYGPIQNLIITLENHGIICIGLDIPIKIDSINVSFIVNEDNIESSIIVYNKDSNYYRQRFSIAHELGHILLHHYIEKDEYEKNLKVIEEQANRFASSFLMPANSFINSFRYPTIKELLAQKSIWGVSAQAVLYRAAQLKIISEKQVSYLMIEISRRGWRKLEPYDDKTQPEVPYYLESAYDYALKNKVMSVQSIKESFALPNEEIIKYIGNKKYFIPVGPNMSFQPL